MHRILGIDPGLNRTGYGVLHRRDRSIILDEAGVIATSTSQSLADRVHEISVEIREIIEQWQPQTVAIEQIFSLTKNPQSAILLAHVRGVVLATAREAGAQVVHYKPTQIKKLLTGSGRANKEQMQLAIQRELQLRELPRPHDMADALALALCHLHSHQFTIDAA